MESLEKLEQVSITEALEDVSSHIADGNIELHVDALELNEYVSDVKEWYNPELEKAEVVTDLEMTESIADYLESVDEVNFENWSKLTIEEKKDVLNRIEQKIAEIEHRPAIRVEIEEMTPRNLGYHSNSEHKIALNSQYVGTNNPNFHREIINTIIHEGRHAYQHYNVDVKCIHESASRVKEWEQNFYDPEWGYYSYKGQKIYIPFNDGKVKDVGYRLYAYQPVEIDARNFASDVLSRLENKGIIKSENS